MSYRFSNINASLPQRHNGPVVANRGMVQLLDATVTGTISANVSNAMFSPELSIVPPRGGSLAVITAKIYNLAVSAGTMFIYPSFSPVAPTTYVGAQLNSVYKSSARQYPAGDLAFFIANNIYIMYSTTSDYVGPPNGGNNGIRIGLWMWA